jgi:hypothetical protein
VLELLQALFVLDFNAFIIAVFNFGKNIWNYFCLKVYLLYYIQYIEFSLESDSMANTTIYLLMTELNGC